MTLKKYAPLAMILTVSLLLILVGCYGEDAPPAETPATREELSTEAPTDAPTMEESAAEDITTETPTDGELTTEEIPVHTGDYSMPY